LILLIVLMKVKDMACRGKRHAISFRGYELEIVVISFVRRGL
jgi:hypothetical protein